jgi:ABC-type Fe3+/spermidine/putrescine transport system ATPase subunit
MNSGRIEQIGVQTDIYLHPRTSFVADFIGANNGLAATVTAIGERDGVESGVEDGAHERSVTLLATGIELHARHTPELRTGQAVLAYIRPENIAVLADGDTTHYDNVVEGTIDRVIFEGPTAQLRVDVGGHELRADVSGTERLTLVQRAGRVRLGFNDVTVIAADDVAASGA